MRRAWTTWLALGLWLLMWALIAFIIVMKLVNWHGTGDTSTSGLIALFVSVIAFGTMGALVAAHVPANPLGWIFLAFALGVTAAGATENYAYHGLVNDPGSLPGALLAGWLYAWAWYPTIGLISFVPLLYPTGRVPGRRWRPVLWGLIGVIGASTLSWMLDPGPLGDDSKLPDNPVGFGFVGNVHDWLDPVTTVVLVPLAGAVALSVVVRFRRSRGDERQQMKWMVFAVAVLAASIVLSSVTRWNGDIVFSIAIVQLPVAVGIAMLKYRLYDIDRLINRTLVYVALTAVLGAAYVGLVLAGQSLSSSLVGSGDLAIAVSTLLVAALFLPLRSRVQRFVDRRFYRRRYDAQRTLEGFGARLREQVELETLRSDLGSVVEDTMQPAHVSVWLREGAAR